MSQRRTKSLKWALAFFSVFLVLILVEIALRYSALFYTYPEVTGKPYTSYYNQELPTWYPFWTPNSSFEFDNRDFKYPYKINSLGFRGEEIQTDVPDSVNHIIVLGDSFAEGAGAPADSSWPELLQIFLDSAGILNEVTNAGISGSDPFFEYVFYRDKLKSVHPDYLIVSINSTDIQDYILRGGFERFHDDSSTHYRKGPWYEFLYINSHLVRAFSLTSFSIKTVVFSLTNQNWPGK